MTSVDQCKVHSIPYSGADSATVKYYGLTHSDDGKKFDSFYNEITDTILLQKNSIRSVMKKRDHSFIHR